MDLNQSQMLNNYDYYFLFVCCATDFLALFSSVSSVYANLGEKKVAQNTVFINICEKMHPDHPDSINWPKKLRMTG